MFPCLQSVDFIEETGDVLTIRVQVSLYLSFQMYNHPLRFLKIPQPKLYHL